jgi:subfamily B ATP-binding cassette protein MsbA
VGASGAGKSTLVNLIPRFYDPTAGSIYLDGVDLCDIRQASLREQIALVPQEPILFHDTIAANIAYARPDASHDEVVEAATAANAHDFIEKFERGYQTMVGDDGVTLSGGQRQRIAIARAVLANPAILILDEASSSLDSISEAAIQEALDRFVVDRTTIVIAHRLSTIEHADRIVVMLDGKVDAVGTHHELLKTSPTYRALHAAQVAGNLRTRDIDQR